MRTSTIAPAESQRLAALTALHILDTAPEERFDHLTDLARRVFGTPMAAITFIDTDHQWIKSGVGIGAGLQLPRQETFCQYTIDHDTTMVVADARTDSRFADIPLVTDEPMIRFYAGHPLHAPTGERVGSLCIADIMVRSFTTDQSEILADLARLVEQELTRTPAHHHLAPPRAPVSTTLPEVAGWQLAGRCPASRQALGGFYDWSADAEHLHLRCGDVTGTPLDVSETSTWVETLLPSPTHPPALTGADHRSPAGGGPGPSAAGPGAAGSGFLTAFAGSLSRDSGHLTYVHPGHGLALILQPDGRHRRLGSTGAPLGIPPQTTKPQTATTTLAPGEVLLVLSDGFLNLQPTPRRAADRTLTRIRRHYPRPLSVHDALDIATDWAATQGHPDDITALAVGRIHTSDAAADTPVPEVRRGIGRIQQVQWAPRLQARSLGI